MRLRSSRIRNTRAACDERHEFLRHDQAFAIGGKSISFKAVVGEKPSIPIDNCPGGKHLGPPPIVRAGAVVDRELRYDVI
jgi:hypothetical protein